MMIITTIKIILKIDSFQLQNLFFCFLNGCKIGNECNKKKSFRRKEPEICLGLAKHPPPPCLNHRWILHKNILGNQINKFILCQSVYKPLIFHFNNVKVYHIFQTIIIVHATLQRKLIFLLFPSILKVLLFYDLFSIKNWTH